MVKLLWFSIICIIVLCEVHCVRHMDYDTMKDDTLEYAGDKVTNWLVRFGLFMVTLFADNKPKTIDEALTIKCYRKHHKEGFKVSHERTDFKGLIDEKKKFALLINSAEDGGAWLNQTAYDYIRHHDINVCSAVWYPLRHLDDAFKLASEKLLKFIENVNDHGKVRYEDMTFVALHMGVEVAATIAANIRAKKRLVGEIFALNPHPAKKDNLATNLDTTDARYVQAISTTKGSLDDLDYQMAHQTFIPNLGVSPQLPCTYRRAVGGSDIDQDKCSEMIVVEYFRYSLNKALHFKAQRCDNSYIYLARQCSKEFDRMGVNANGERDGRFYLETFGGPPYVALNHKKEYRKKKRIEMEKKKEEEEKEDEISEEEPDKEESESEEETEMEDRKSEENKSEEKRSEEKQSEEKESEEKESKEKEMKKKKSEEEDDDNKFEGFDFSSKEEDEKKKKKEDKDEKEEKDKKRKKEDEDEENDKKKKKESNEEEEEDTHKKKKHHKDDEEEEEKHKKKEDKDADHKEHDHKKHGKDKKKGNKKKDQENVSHEEKDPHKDHHKKHKDGKENHDGHHKHKHEHHEGKHHGGHKHKQHKKHH